MRLCLILLLAIVFEASAQTEKSIPIQSDIDIEMLEKKIDSLERQNLQLEERYKYLQTGLSEVKTLSQAILLKRTPKKADIDTVLNLQKKIESLELRFSHKLKLDEEKRGSGFGLASLMLGAAGLIVTGVSLIIAIFAFWGYRNIKKEASDYAAVKSEQLVESKINDGEFDEVVFRAVQKTIYRGILSNEDFPEDEGDTDESL